MDLSRHQGLCHSFLPRLRRGLAPLILLALAPALPAEEPRTVNYLLFDPVLIDSRVGEEGETHDMVEMTSLPSSALAWDLQDYLRSREQDETAMPTDPTRYLRTIEALEAGGDAYEPDLVEELLALGDLHRQRGEYQEAVNAFQRAFHIKRVSDGLYDMSQTPIIERLIETHLAAGNLAQADEQQEYLFLVQRKTHGPDSPELLQAMSSLADWNLFAFNAHWGWPFAVRPLISSGADLLGPSRPASSPDRSPTHRLLDAQYLYDQVIRKLRHSTDGGDPRLGDAERKLAMTHYFFATSMDMNAGSPSVRSLSSTDFADGGARLNSPGFREGREALERRLAYLRETPDSSPEAIAEAMMELGDWLLIFRRREAALESYQAAYREFQEAAGEQADRQHPDRMPHPDTSAAGRLFSPALPVTIPTFLAQPYTRAALGIPEDLPLQYKGYVDVAFQLNRYGSASQVEFLGGTENVNDDLRALMRRQIRQTRYRPHLMAGEPVDDAEFRMRYYFTW